MRLFHATSPENALQILQNGFNIQYSPEMYLGKGVYLTSKIDEAKFYGNTILTVDIDDGDNVCIGNDDKAYVGLLEDKGMYYDEDLQREIMDCPDFSCLKGIAKKYNLPDLLPDASLPIDTIKDQAIMRLKTIDMDTYYTSRYDAEASQQAKYQMHHGCDVYVTETQVVIYNPNVLKQLHKAGKIKLLEF